MPVVLDAVAKQGVLNTWRRAIYTAVALSATSVVATAMYKKSSPPFAGNMGIVANAPKKKHDDDDDE